MLIYKFFLILFLITLVQFYWGIENLGLLKPETIFWYYNTLLDTNGIFRKTKAQFFEVEKQNFETKSNLKVKIWKNLFFIKSNWMIEPSIDLNKSTHKFRGVFILNKLKKLTPIGEIVNSVRELFCQIVFYLLTFVIHFLILSLVIRK